MKHELLGTSYALIGKRLKKIREINGLSLSSVAEYLNSPVSVVKDIEQGKHTLSLFLLLDMCEDAYKCSLETVLRDVPQLSPARRRKYWISMCQHKYISIGECAAILHFTYQEIERELQNFPFEKIHRF